MQRSSPSAVVVGAVFLLSGCVAAVIGNAPQSGTATDQRARAPANADAALSSAVSVRIGADAALRSAPISVSAYHGTVTLSGTVASGALRANAERTARAVAGVSAVNNQLKVK